MTDREKAVPLGEFQRERWHFTVSAEGGKHRVDAREDDSSGELVCRIHSMFTPAEWFPTWRNGAWRPWIEREALRIITEAEQADHPRE